MIIITMIISIVIIFIIFAWLFQVEIKRIAKAKKECIEECTELNKNRMVINFTCVC